MGNGQPLHTLIPLADFKAVLGVDDRENALSRFCLITATYAIEQYCKRRLLRKKRFEFFPFYGDYTFPLRDLSGLKVHYRAGYVPGKTPADMASACLELAAWNMSRYRGPPSRKRVLDRDDRECPGEWEGRGTSGNVYAGECPLASGVIQEADYMTDKVLFIEEIIINSLRVCAVSFQQQGYKRKARHL
jgi:hypothetical protein